MTNVTATQNTLVTDAKALGNWIGLCTGAPGSTATPSNEASGGSPAYARQSTTWMVAGATATGSSVTIHVPAGTYSYMIQCSGSSGNNMVDWCPITPQVITSQSTITFIPLLTAS
jgi:hypothetical protein